MAGRASIELKSRELGMDPSDDPDSVARVTNRVKGSEARGWSFEAADASFELMVRRETDLMPTAVYELESWRTLVERQATAPW